MKMFYAVWEVMQGINDPALRVSVHIETFDTHQQALDYILAYQRPCFQLVIQELWESVTLGVDRKYDLKDQGFEISGSMIDSFYAERRMRDSFTDDLRHAAETVLTMAYNKLDFDLPNEGQAKHKELLKSLVVMSVEVAKGFVEQLQSETLSKFGPMPEKFKNINE